LKRRVSWLLLLLISLSSPLFAGEVTEISLPARPAPVNVDLVRALEQRRTTREYAAEKLSLEDLSAILWAANGANRPDGKRTAPSAYGKQNFFIYGEIVADDLTIQSYIGRNSRIAGTNERFPSLDAALDFPLYFILEEVIKGFLNPPCSETGTSASRLSMRTTGR
jgi:Nitroreductase family